MVSINRTLTFAVLIAAARAVKDVDQTMDAADSAIEPGHGRAHAVVVRSQVCRSVPSKLLAQLPKVQFVREIDVLGMRASIFVAMKPSPPSSPPKKLPLLDVQRIFFLPRREMRAERLPVVVFQLQVGIGEFIAQCLFERFVLVEFPQRVE